MTLCASAHRRKRHYIEAMCNTTLYFILVVEYYELVGYFNYMDWKSFSLVLFYIFSRWNGDTVKSRSETTLLYL
jgi:hypothetical protein